MQLRVLALAAAAAAALSPALASAQEFGWDSDYRSPPPRAFAGYDRDGGYGDPLQARQDRLRAWMRRGSQEGWLSGWRAERAWGEFRTLRSEGGYDRRDAWRRLDRLSQFVRWAHDNAED